MPARDTAERIADAQHRLASDHDLWITTAADGRPWLVPLSFHWNGEAVLMATVRKSPTYRNIAAGGTVRLALGHTRDVVMLDGDVDLPDRLDDADADAVASASGYDPRTDADTAYIRFVPRRAQAWRNVEEIQGRTIMRDGRWGAPPR